MSLSRLLFLLSLPLCLAAQTRDRNPYHSEKDAAEGRRLPNDRSARYAAFHLIAF
jgi:hypothetical protein